MDAAGVGLTPAAVLIGSLTVSLTVAFSLSKGTKPAWSDQLAWLGIVIAVGAWLLRIAWPSLLPPGHGSDLTHHLLLVDYIERARHLVHDRALEGAMGEMAHYTPGAHLSAVLFGVWSGTDGLHAFYPLIAAGAALTAGFIFLIARRLRLPVPFAIASVMLLMLPLDYFTGAFTNDAFLAQAVCACFAVAAWWALVAWEEQPSAALAAVFGLFVTAVFLAWPVWIGPPLLVFAALLLRRDVSLGWRLRHAVIGLAPLAIVGSIHVVGRLGWALLVRTSGAVLQPSMAVVGWVFPILALIGVTVAVRNRRARIVLAFLLAIAAQAVTLWFMSKSIGAETPYMAYKMGYLAIYPLAILGAFALHAGVSRAAQSVQVSTGWVIATIMLVLIVRPAINAPRPIPVVSSDLYHAGQWMRANVGAGCADYLVNSADTAYWLHLAVLGNPRSSARTAEIDRYEPRQVMGQWVTDRGRGYAVADLTLLPDEVRKNVQVMKEFGRAAVIRGRASSELPCDAH
jgi:hypothetical protein